MNLVPVANEGEDQQYQGDQQQSARLRCIDCMAVVFRRGLVFGLGAQHGAIVALRGGLWYRAFGHGKVASAEI